MTLDYISCVRHDGVACIVCSGLAAGLDLIYFTYIGYCTNYYHSFRPIHYNYLHIRRLLVPSAAAADFGVMALVDGDVGFGAAAVGVAAADHCLH